eukprot:scaffold640_cov180-Alexandrium_tamarense.AAC.8
MVNRWKVASAVFKVAKAGKKSTKKEDEQQHQQSAKNNKGKKSINKQVAVNSSDEAEESSSSSSSGSEYSSIGEEEGSYSGGEYSSSEEELSVDDAKKRGTLNKPTASNSGVNKTNRAGVGGGSDNGGDSSSDDSSSYGCGTYHRRESLSVGSQSSLPADSHKESDDDSSSYYSSSRSSGSGSYSSKSSHGSKSQHQEDTKAASSTRSSSKVEASEHGEASAVSSIETDTNKKKAKGNLTKVKGNSFRLLKNVVKATTSIRRKSVDEAAPPDTSKLVRRISRQSSESSVSSSDEEESVSASEEEEDESSAASGDESESAVSDDASSSEGRSKVSSSRRRNTGSASVASSKGTGITTSTHSNASDVVVNKKPNKGKANAKVKTAPERSDPVINSLVPTSLYDNEQVQMLQRRRSSGSGGSAGGRGGRATGGRGGRGGYPRRASNGGSEVSSSSNNQPKKEVEDTFSDLLSKIRKAKEEKGEMKEEAENKFAALLGKVRKNKAAEASESVESDSNDNVDTSRRDETGDLTRSFRKQLLANANSNLRSSTNDDDEENTTVATPKKEMSSRFASMMKDLKTANDAADATSSVRKDVESSDDENMFEAPTLVYQRESMRDLLSNERSEASLASNDDEGKGSRARGLGASAVRSEDESDSDYSMKSLSTASSAEEEESGSDDDDYSEQEMTILTPIIEADSESQTATYVMPQSNRSSMRSSQTEESGDSVERFNSTVSPREATSPDNRAKSCQGSGESAGSSSASDVEMDVDSAHSTDYGESISVDGDEIEDVSEVESVEEEEEESSTRLHEDNAFIATLIARVRKNDASLTEIQIDGDGVEDVDAADLFRSLHDNEHITSLSMARNNLGDVSATTLSKVLFGNETITHVNLAGNNIGNKGALALKKVLKVNQTLVAIDLNDNSIDQYLLDELRKKSSVFVASSITGDTAAVESNEVGSRSSIEVDSVANSETMRSSQNGADHASSEDTKSLNSSKGDTPSADESVSQSKANAKEEVMCKLLGFDDSVDAAQAKEREIFQNAFATAQKSDSPTPDEDALLLAVSLALYDLDSQWALNIPSSSRSGRKAKSACVTLGERKRVTPWMKAPVKQNGNATKSNAPQQNGHATSDSSLSPKRKDPAVKAYVAKLKSSITCANSLRRSLLELSATDIHAMDESVSDRDFKQSLSKSEGKPQQWASSFKKLDPRWQIRKFFDDMSVFGSVLSADQSTAIFSVWRPTSADAIAKMMRGDGVGKGLEIKGKSAKCGDLSGYIPFLQIHQEEHKSQIRTIPKADRTKIFFKSREARDEVGLYLGGVAKDMTMKVAKAKFALAKAKIGCNAETILQQELFYASKSMPFELENPKVVQNDEYAPESYCIEVSCRVLWEGLVAKKEISREPGSGFDTGRASQPTFQDMNFAALRQRKPEEPLPVLVQCSDDPFDARMLVMAYEEEGRVVPVVSDFDCFLIGSKDFSFEDEMSPDQVDLLEWCISQIEWILDNHTDPDSWTTRWLEVLKHAARQGFYPKMPRFGFGDPTSYSMIEAAVGRSSKTCGAVRHGPECFNYFFPQDLDEELLVIFPGNKIWKYVTVKELQSILLQKIKEGYTMPLNPKWVLCDPGWINLFEELIKSDHLSVKKSVDLWFPPKSGLRERIINISRRHPNGFLRDEEIRVNSSLLEQEYERYLVLQRAKKKVRGYIYWRNLLEDARNKAEADIDDSCRASLQSLQFLGQKKLRRLSSGDNVEDDTISAIDKLEFFCNEGNDHSIECSSRSSDDSSEY